MWGWRRPARATTFIDEGCDLEGRARFTGVTVISGRFSGSQIAADTLIVAEKATVTAAIDAQRVSVFGRVVGDIRARERVEVEDGGTVTGDVDAPVLVLNDGAVLDGRCRTPGNVTRGASTGPPARPAPRTEHALDASA